MGMIQEFLVSFISFFTVIDPIGTIPVFIAVTARMNATKRKKVAIKATIVSTAVLLFFLVVGEIILNVIDIPLAGFQISGGIILFLFALTMIFGQSKPEEELSNADDNDDAAIFPLSMPSIASPGAIMAAILLTENTKYSIKEQALTSVAMIFVLLVTLLLMLSANKLFKYIGNSGAAIISRVMGLILSSVAVSNILEGVGTFFSISHL